MADRSADWMDQAARDLDNARHAQEGGFHEWACFSAQQAAEKALKAVYHHLGGEAWGHSVYELLLGLEERAAVTEAMKDCGRDLDRFYIPTRYPNGLPHGKPGDAFVTKDSLHAIACGEKILRFGQGLLARPEPGD